LLGKNSPGRAVPEDWTKFVQTLRGTRAADADKVKKPEITLPEDYVSIIKGTKAHGYLMERGISDEQIAFYQIGFGTQDLREVDSAERHKFAGSGRIIFPDFDSDGRCIYWVARTYMGHKIKYKNPARSNARDQVYNLAKASQFTACIIAEGVISAIACGYNGVATYGKEVTKEQVSMLVAAAFDHYIVAHDGDARRTSLTLAQRLMRRGCTVSLVEFARDQDPASVPDIRDRLDRALPYSLKNHLVFRLEENKVL
jgi:DNA primase